MTRPRVYNLRLSDDEFERLQAYAESKQITGAEVLRQYIQRLPKPKGEKMEQDI